MTDVLPCLSVLPICLSHSLCTAFLPLGPLSCWLGGHAHVHNIRVDEPVTGVMTDRGQAGRLV